MKKIFGIILGVSCSSSASADALICREFLTNPIVTKSTYQANLKSAESFKKLQCSSSWKSAEDVAKAGIDITVPVYDIPIPINANWDSKKVEQWKKEHCSDEERNGSYIGSLYQSFYEVNPISARAAVECIKETSAKDAIRCGVTETENSIVFSAEWRRTNGEPESSSPKIISISFDNANCLNVVDFSPGKNVIEGGLALLCKPSDITPIFVLSTNRGQCVEYGMDKTDVYTLSGKMELSSSLLVNASRVKIKDDFELVTNGNQVQIYANNILEIEGSPSIVSYKEPDVTKQMSPGGSAAPILIKAKKIKGGGLSINNSGQNGGPGINGIDGLTGSSGTPGVGRDPVTKSSGNIWEKIIEAVPKSCTGGKKGGDGSPGGDGSDGIPGGPGGAAGQVTLMLPLDLSASEHISVLTGVGLDNNPRLDCANQICGGRGGVGGSGGAGGAGGPGGKGAPGTTWCGGTDSGRQGQSGKPGKDAGPGMTGAPANLVYQ